jgi:hypothetical protein
MKRVTALTVALCFVCASSAFAQSRAQARPDFSPKAAGITPAASATLKAVEFRRETSPPRKASTKKKVTWIAVGVAIVAVAFVISKAYDSEGGGY